MKVVSKVFAINWHIDEESGERTLIRIFGINENNESVYVLVQDFTPYIYVELPENIEWNSLKCQMLCNKIEEICTKKRSPIKKRLVFKRKMYYAHKEKVEGEYIDKSFPFLFLSFNSQKDVKFFYYNTRKPIYISGLGPIRLKVHENNASPILQLTCCRKIPTAGWIQFIGTRIENEDKESLCKHEFIVEYKSLSPLSERDELFNVVPKPKIMGMDIEVNSTNINTMPKVEKPGDKVFQISCVFSIQGDKNYEKYLLSLGKPSQEVVGKEINILTFDTEADLLEGYASLIREKDPQIIVGYNIFSFDIPYMLGRAKMNGSIYHFDQQGCLIGKHGKEKEISWSSSAYKNQNFYFLDVEGRLFVDLLPLVKRDYKFNNYKLKTISTHFLGETKDPLTHLGIFKCYRLFTPKSLGIVGKYCVVDSELVVKLFDHLKYWVGLCEMAKVCKIPILYLYTQGQQIRVFSSIYYSCMYSNYVVERDAYITKSDEFYTGAYVFEPQPGLYNYVASFDFCLGGNTLISTSSGTSIKLKNIQSERMVYGCNEDGKIESYSMIGKLQIKGKRETVKAILQNGREIVATPDHKFMLENGDWCEAKDLKDKKIKCGIEQPEDFICPKEKNWRLVTEGYIFNFENEKEREKTLAFFRILGYSLTKSCSFNNNDLEAKFKTEFDAISFINNLKMIVNENIIYTVNYSIVSVFIPSKIVIMLLSLRGIQIGNWIKIFPSFLKCDFCPKSALREFIAAFFGGDGFVGTVPNLVCNTICFHDIKTILYYTFNIRSNTSSYSVIVDNNNIKTFQTKIGFRYSINESNRLYLLSSYLSISSIYTFYTFSEYMLKVNFQGNNSTVNFLVENVIPNGIEEVYDIEVDKVHNFLANGAVVHNCSLYPSTIITYNIDYSTLVLDDKIPDEMCHIFDWTDHQNCEHDPKYKPSSKVEKRVICKARYFRFLKEPMGILPSILVDLLAARKNTNGEISRLKDELKSDNISIERKEEINSLLTVLDKRQLAYKVVANSAYGALGTRQGYLPFMPGAMCTTARGRESIIKASQILKNYGAHIVYGDSVSGDTPILIRYPDQTIDIKTIETVGNEWFPYEEFKKEDSNRKNKQQSMVDLEIWTNGKWSKIKRVIRHKTEKRMFRVNTHTGCIDVSEDHSLLSDKEEKVKPIDLKIGDKLLHSFPNFETSDYFFNLDEFTIRCEGKIESQTLFYSLKSSGYKYVSIDINEEEKNAYYISASKNEYKQDPIAVKKIVELPSVKDEFIYDIETESGQFHAGVGELVLKNTDSNYIQFEGVSHDPKKYYDYCLKIEKRLEEAFPKPMKLAFEEKIYEQFLIFTKKRYIATQMNRDGKIKMNKENHFDLFNRGVLMARRDNSKYLRDLFSETITLIFEKKKEVEILDYIVNKINLLFTMQVNVKDLVITKSVGETDINPDNKSMIGDYKIKQLPDDPKKRQKRLKELGFVEGEFTEQEFFEKTIPAQAQLAIRMKRRGMIVDAGTRLEYVILTSDSVKMFDKIEDIEYYTQHKDILRLDYLYYLHLAIKPIDEILKTVFSREKFVKEQYDLRCKKQEICNKIKKVNNLQITFL